MNALKTTIIALALAAAPIAVTASYAETPSQPAASAEGGVYLEGIGGWNTLGGAQAPSASPLDPALSTLGSGASLGWQPMESLRVELEYLYRNADGDRVGAIAESAGTPDSRSLMANALIDFDITDWATPYVGVGVGWTRVEPVTGFNSGADVFAYQGIVGLSVPFTDTLSFFADGRFMRSDEFSLGAASVTPGHLQSWSALAGLRFTFGGGN